MSQAASALIVLYVEDEPLVQDLVAAALQEAGFEVKLASSGVEALEILHSHTGGPRALVTDINLPGAVDGWMVAQSARKLFPSIPVVFVSGASEHEWASKGVPESIMISKPFVPTQVVAALTALMEAAEARAPLAGA